MLTSFSEFKFYQSFRIPVEASDDLRFLVELESELNTNHYLQDARLVDISVTGLGFATKEKISVGTNIKMSVQMKKMHVDLVGIVVRAFAVTSEDLENEEMIYGVELEDDKRVHRFLEQYIMGFSPDRLRGCLIESALKERYTKASDGFEMFSLLLSLFKDINNFSDKEGFIDSMLDEVVRILNAQRASIFLINPETNELEAVNAMGVNKEVLKFDYRLGIAGSVFTTGVALNIDTDKDKTRFNEKFDKQLGFKTKSIICYPIYNRSDKIIGVIEVLNKRNQDRFTVEDEKTMKVLSLVFSSVFHQYDPISEMTMIRRFSTPFDRENVMIGRSPHISNLRKTLLKVKDIESPILISGERGTGKVLYAKIIHIEGQRGLKSFDVVDCCTQNDIELEKELFGDKTTNSKLITTQAGSIVIRNIDMLSLEMQEKLYKALIDRRVPSSKAIVDVRVIATTIKDIEEMCENGNFHSGLYDYISRIQINIEPLRRRIDDLQDLVDYFLKIECKKQGLLLKKFSMKAIEKFKKYDWPGNVQELQKCIARAVVFNPKLHIITEHEIESLEAPVVDLDLKKRAFGDIPFAYDQSIPLRDRLALVEREMILHEIKRYDGNKSKAALAMGMSREALRKKLISFDEIFNELMKKQYSNACHIEKKAA